jgi:hypothetical protein
MIEAPRLLLVQVVIAIRVNNINPPRPYFSDPCPDQITDNVNNLGGLCSEVHKLNYNPLHSSHIKSGVRECGNQGALKRT